MAFSINYIIDALNDYRSSGTPNSKKNVSSVIKMLKDGSFSYDNCSDDQFATLVAATVSKDFEEHPNSTKTDGDIFDELFAQFSKKK